MDHNEQSFEETDFGLQEGHQTKCEACGSTDIALNIETGMLRCKFCRHEQAGAKFEKTETDIKNLTEEVVGAGAANIEAEANDILTFKCSSCGAEVIVDTSESAQARCHWCRNTLSINEQIPNGAVPDKVLPFATNKEAARAEIEKFVQKRQFYAHPNFKKEFTVENVMGVYMPYMVVDANVQGQFKGEGEIETRRWTETRQVGSGKNRRTIVTTYYDADRYSIGRDFDMTVEGLTIESNSEKLKHGSSNRTNNVINAIKPFETEKAMKWDANYMTGFTAEKRDTNIDDLRGLVDVKMKDIARHQISDTIRPYNRGVRWLSENLNVIGKQWKAAYFPVWLYSHQHNKKIHYVAVNGQTLKTMGSVPINQGKLFLFSLLIGLICGALGWFGATALAENVEPFWAAAAFVVPFLLGLGINYSVVRKKYRNKGARFEHERDTAANIHNMRSEDKVVKQIRRTTESRMSGANSAKVKYKGGS